MVDFLFKSIIVRLGERAPCSTSGKGYMLYASGYLCLYTVFVCIWVLTLQLSGMVVLYTFYLSVWSFVK